MSRKVIAIAGAVFIALIVSLVVVSGEDAPEQKEVEDIKQLVEDYSANRTVEQSASITSHELLVTNSDESQSTYALPEDEFFVSIAPYIENTHPCAFHNLTGCTGELFEEEFNVYIEDTEGNVVVDETMTSLSNGFIDLWLPRDKNYRVKIENDGNTAETELSTFEGDNTCITTMQLA